jgi:hypothetical protein
VQHVQLAERTGERAGGGAVHDELTRLPLPIEVPVRHRQQPQVRERGRAALMPEPARLELLLDGLRQRLDRRVVSREREQQRG